VVFGDHGYGHGAGPALGLGEMGTVSGQSLEFEGVPAEEDIRNAALPGDAFLWSSSDAWAQLSSSGPHCGTAD
jgi:hypothetical protein